MRDSLRSEGVDAVSLDFETNIKIATHLSEMVSRDFNDGKIEIEGIDTKTVFETGIKPIKKWCLISLVNTALKMI